MAWTASKNIGTRRAPWLWNTAYAEGVLAGQDTEMKFTYDLIRKTPIIRQTMNNLKTSGEQVRNILHGTKSIWARWPDEVGFDSNYGTRRKAKYVYFAATLEAAIWGAELHRRRCGKIYVVSQLDIMRMIQPYKQEVPGKSNKIISSLSALR